MSDHPHVTIIGAGIIGINCAIALLKTGCKVTVIDRLPPGEGCSFGNAGLLAASAYEPLASPSTMLEVPGWLLNPESPLVIRWRHFPRLLPWLMRYGLAGMFGGGVKVEDALYHLMAPSVEYYQQLAAEAGAPDLVKAGGALYAFSSLKKIEAERAGFEARRKRGFRVTELSAHEMFEHEPHLSRHYKGGFLANDYAHVINPGRMVTSLADYACRLGAVIEQADILDIEIGTNGPTHLVTDTGKREIDRLVIAAGAYSHQLTAKLGDKLPLETERGYHVTIENPGVMPTVPVMDDVLKAWVTPMEMGLRCAGTVELADLESPPSEKRQEMLVRLAKRMVPDIDTSNYTGWMGRRPTLPDSVPVIGPATSFTNVFYAFGHQHLGLTGAPATGRLVAQLVNGEIPNFDISAYRANRF
ncbi:MAG: FAD-binding oxidoreductase [Rhodospirillales bacterium]|nr:FAD-binding oxidoreductase [Rhodospirillales bacterium]